MIKLRNLKRRLRSFNLEHPAFVNRTGEHAVGKPETLTLLPLEVREVEDEVALCAEIKSALKPRDGSRATLRILS